MSTAPTTIGNIDRTLTSAEVLFRAALERGALAEARAVNERIDNLLDHRLAQMALTS